MTYEGAKNKILTEGWHYPTPKQVGSNLLIPPVVASLYVPYGRESRWARLLTDGDIWIYSNDGIWNDFYSPNSARVPL